MKAKVDALRVPTMPASEGRALDWTKAQKVVLPDLKASTETISLRMPAPLLHAIKREANRRDATKLVTRHKPQVTAAAPAA